MEDVYSLFSAARKAEEAGELHKATELYNQVMEGYPDSHEATAARRSLGILDGGRSAGSLQKPEEDYTAARGISMLIAGVGWFYAIAAVLLGFVGAYQAPPAATPIIVGLAAMSVVGGLMMVVMGQATRALVDMANNVARIYSVIKMK